MLDLGFSETSQNFSSFRQLFFSINSKGVPKEEKIKKQSIALAIFQHFSKCRVHQGIVISIHAKIMFLKIPEAKNSLCDKRIKCAIHISLCIFLETFFLSNLIHLVKNLP
jgi:hypothetical protein